MANYKLLLPKMGESVAEATIIRWTKNPGDYIAADETVMEIATDKVDSDVPSPVSGKLLEQLYKENDVVQVGAVIAIIQTDEPDEVAAPAVTTPAQQPATETPPPPPVQQPVAETPPPPPIQHQATEIPAQPPVQQPAASAPAPIETVIPDAERPLSEPVPETPGPEARELDEIKQPIFSEQREELAQPVPYMPPADQGETEKPGEGKNQGRFYSPLVKNIAAQEGISNAELDQIPGTGAEGRLTKDDLLNYIQNKYQAAPAPQNDTEATATVTPSQPFENLTSNEPLSETNAGEVEPAMETTPPEPVSSASEPAEIAQSAPLFEVPEETKAFEAPEPQPAEEPRAEPAMEQPSPQPVKQEPVSAGASLSGGDEIIEMDRMRRLIADHMVMSKHTSAHVTSFVEADVTNLVIWRDKIKNAFEKREGQKITFTPIFIEAVVRAIKDLPMINISVNGTQIIKKKDINISMATALPSGNLIVPVIKRADELSLIGLTKAVNDLANRARTNKLKPDDVQGGTFTITNVGSFGNVMGTPIINQPQVAILAVGAIRKKPAVIETLQGDMIGIRHMMFLSLSYDHRVVDGALGGSFVRRVADYLENWDVGREI